MASLLQHLTKVEFKFPSKMYPLEGSRNPEKKTHSWRTATVNTIIKNPFLTSDDSEILSSTCHCCLPQYLLSPLLFPRTCAVAMTPSWSLSITIMLQQHRRTIFSHIQHGTEYNMYSCSLFCFLQVQCRFYFYFCSQLAEIVLTIFLIYNAH